MLFLYQFITFICGVSFILLCIGIFKPKISLFWYKGERTRQKNLIFNGCIVLATALIGGGLSTISDDVKKFIKEREKQIQQVKENNKKENKESQETKTQETKTNVETEKLEKTNEKQNDKEQTQIIISKEEDEEYKKVGVKFGLSEETRIEIARKYIEVERKCLKETEKIYYTSGAIEKMEGTPQEKQIKIGKHRLEMETREMEQLCKNSKITEEQLKYIRKEMIYKEWHTLPY